MTKGEIDRLGISIGGSAIVANNNLEQLQTYRKTFQEPLSRVFTFVLGAARKIDRQCIVTYRIKRIDTIIEKLRRFKDDPHGKMTLSRMWDIAGCRCIMNISNFDKLYALKDVIINEYGEECKINDYIASPRDSGYRSLHIYVKDKLTQQPIEIQIRNRLQHNWATLVEIVDLLYATKNKEQGIKGQLGRFLFLFSKADELSEDDFEEMLNTETKMKVFERMSQVLTRNYLNIRRQWLSQKQFGSYYVITANKRMSEIVSFPTFKEAEQAYYDKYLSNRDSNIVLTHLQNPDFDQISIAYSNYVLAMHAFFDDFRAVLARQIIECARNSQYRKFNKYFSIYNNDVRYHFENMSLEVKEIESCNSDPSISKHQVNKWIKEIKERILSWYGETQLFLRQLVKVINGSSVKKWFISQRVESLARAIEAGQAVLKK